MPVTTVQLEGEIGFTLDDAQKGVLDNAEFTLGNLFNDITPYVVSVSMARGKNRDLDRFSAGSLSISLRNETRAFDPLYNASPFYGSVLPRRLVNIYTDGVQQFSGIIEDWNLEYDVSGESVATIQAADAFTILAQQQLTAGTAIGGQTTGARVNAVLNQSSIAWPVAKRQVDTGQSTLGADVFDGNALEYLQTVETSEQGSLFIGKSGDLVFLDRTVTPTSAVGILEFADDGTGIPYNSATVNYGTELLINQVTVTSAAGTAVANNSASQGSYETVAEEIATLVNSVSQLQNIADYIVAQHGDPEYRFETISVRLNDLEPAQVASVLDLEIGDLLQVTFTPNGIGDPIVQLGQVIKLDNSVGIDVHDVTIGVASVQFTALVLDDVVFGKLDSTYVLAF
jgi:hypothetical protein